MYVCSYVLCCAVVVVVVVVVVIVACGLNSRMALVGPKFPERRTLGTSISGGGKWHLHLE
jgi:hypothetical protein